MQCPRCHSECPPEYDFCPHCATPLQTTCPRCGFRAPAGFLFCPRCGTALTSPPAPLLKPEGRLQDRGDGLPPTDERMERLLRQVPKEYAERLLATRGQPHDERRTVTILFSDIKGSTAMIDKLDPEDAKEVIQGAFEFLIGPIFRYEGTLVQLMGDAILAFFGAPIAHEDDPERACRAGLEITAKAAKYAKEIKERKGIEGFAVRVGINTGLVIVGEVGSDLRVAYTAIGDAINLAARMEQNAEPGTVLITEATHRLVAPLFETQAMPPLVVKGKAEPVSTYRVLGAKAEVGKVRGIAGLESPLVGRDAEMATLREAAERLQAGVGGIVTIVGEAGLGKSRLVAEVRRECSGSAGCQPAAQGDADYQSAVRTEIRWVEGRCLSYGTSIAYLLWLDVLRGLLGVTAEDSPERVRDILWERAQTLCPDSAERYLPYLARLLSLPLDAETAARLRDLDGQELKANTFAAVEAFLACAAGECPLAIVLEDLHWADPTSLELLERLLALTDRASLLFLCVFRPQPEHGSWHIREIAAGTYPHRHTDLRLRPLSNADSETLLGNLLDTRTLPAAFRDRVLRHAEGNPFYVEEILRALIGSAALVQDDAGRWQLTQDVDDLPIPETLQGVLLARIDRLHEDTKRILQMAAVIGRTFLYRLLDAMAAQQKELDAHLITLQREQMIRERARIPELEYIFKHHLTQEAAYNGLLKQERRNLHRQVAGALERLFPERLEELAGLLAYHWEQAADAAKAAYYLLHAGDQARLAYTHAEAADYYRRALAFQEKQEDLEPAARTWMKLGLTCQTTGDFSRARAAFEAGFRLWQRAAEAPHGPLASAPHALRMAWPYLEGLDMCKCATADTTEVLTHLFPTLVQESADLGVAPEVAQRWEASAEGRQWTFHLRHDVQWSDGAPVTARDFEYALKRMLHPATAAPLASLLLYGIRGARAYHQGAVADPDSVGVRAVDDWTLVVELEQPCTYLLHVFSFVSAVPRHVVERCGEAWTHPAHIVTSGPFRIESLEPGQWLTLVRDPAYRGARKGNVERVELTLRTRDEMCDELATYETGALDVLEVGYDPELDALRVAHPDEYLSVPSLSTHFLALDAGRPPFDDLRVRQALAMATDRESLCEVVLRGTVFPAPGGLLPPGMPGHSAGIVWPYDPQRARALLAEAGYAGGHGFPTLQLLSVRGPISRVVMPALEEQWRENLGIESTLEMLPAEQMTDRLLSRPVHLVMNGWVADYPDPDTFLRVMLEHWQQFTRWDHPPYRELVRRAQRAPEPAERLAWYAQADRILAEEAALIPLAYSRTHWLVKPWVRNYVQSPTGRLFWQDVVIEEHGT